MSPRPKVPDGGQVSAPFVTPATENPPPLVSFVVPLFNCLALTQAMVASLKATLPRGLPHELILVDDGSTDGTSAWLDSLDEPSIRTLGNEGNVGFAVSTNRGAAAARADILVLLNNDLILTPGWLEPLLSEFSRLGTRAGAIGNVQRTVQDGTVDHVGIVINLKGKPEHERDLSAGSLWSRLRGARRVDAVTGACLLIARSLWLELGGFDERFVNGCEDVDLCFRTTAHRRVNLVVLRSVVKHHVSSSAGRKRRDEVNTLRLTLKWRDTLVILAARRWCLDFLNRAWTHPREPVDVTNAAAAFFYGLHLLPNPPSFALLAMNASVDLELTRWRALGLDTA